METTNTGFAQLRQNVAELDQLIVQTLARRMKLTEEAVKFKKSRADITDASLREKVAARAKGWGAELALPESLIEQVYAAILAHSVERQLALFQE